MSARCWISRRGKHCVVTTNRAALAVIRYYKAVGRVEQAEKARERRAALLRVMADPTVSKVRPDLKDRRAWARWAMAEWPDKGSAATSAGAPRAATGAPSGAGGASRG